LKNNIHKKSIVSIIVIKKITKEKPKNFQIMKSLLFIGLLKIKKIVFHSISLKRSWLHINKTQISQKISIVDNQKSIMIFFVSQIVKLSSNKEKNIKIIQKKIIIYKYLFLIISLKVFNVMLNIIFKIYNLKNLYFNL
jgi:hypothetical protein